MRWGKTKMNNELKMESAGNPTEFKMKSAGNPTEFKMESAGNPLNPTEF